MVLRKKNCLCCGKTFNNIRKGNTNLALGSKQFGKTKYCSNLCSGKQRTKTNRFRFNGENCYIFLENKNKEAIIDKEDYSKVEKLHWILDSLHYPISTNGQPRIRLHNLLLEKRDGYEVDHINKNSLDNRKNNLRLIPHYLNVHNQRFNHKNKTGIRNIYVKRNKYFVVIALRKKIYRLGTFSELHKAKEKIDEFRKTHIDPLYSIYNGTPSKLP